MIFKKYGYAWLTLGFFLVSLILHWLFGWQAFANDAAEHNQQPETSAYLAEMLRDTFENWQSEFLQLIWQVVGLAYFLYIGSPASRESDDRVEAKVDALLHLQGAKGRDMIAKLDEHFLRNEGHAKMMKHDELDAILAGERHKGDA
jgi:hypothetical protein